MKVWIARPTELSESDCQKWEEIQAGNPLLASPFLSAHFARSVGICKPQARVAVIEEANEIIGFFPFEVSRTGFGKPIAWAVNDCQGLITAADARIDVVELIRKCGLRTWEFDNLVADQVDFEPMHHTRLAAPVIDVSAGWEAYVEGKRQSKSRLISHTGTKRRGLARNAGPVEIVFEDRSVDSLAQLVAWKREQYRRTRVPDILARPWVRDLLEHLFADGRPGCRLILSSLFAGDRLVAAHLALSSESVMGAWFPAYDPEYRRYSPGRILDLGVVEGAAEEGMSRIDLGKNHTEAKDRFKTGDLYVAEGCVVTDSWLSKARGRQLRASSEAAALVKSEIRSRPKVRAAVRAVRRAALSRRDR